MFNSIRNITPPKNREILIPSNEGLTEEVLTHVIKTIVAYLSIKIVGLAEISVFNLYKKWKESKDKHIATVIQYNILITYLKGASEVSQIISTFTSLTLPKTADE